MTKKILVIFLFAVIIIYIIYNLSNNYKEKALIVGEEIPDFKISQKDTKTFLYDNITYKELVRNIKNNDSITIKNKKIYLNRLIAKSNYIIITANKNKCESNKVYSKRVKEDIDKLTKVIKRISNAKILIIDYCSVL